MKAATQSCSGKKAPSTFRQNPQKTSPKDPTLYQSQMLEACNLTKKETLQAYPGPELFLLRFRISRTPIF